MFRVACFVVVRPTDLRRVFSVCIRGELLVCYYEVRGREPTLEIGLISESLGVYAILGLTSRPRV